MRELRRISLTLRLIQHTEMSTMARKIPEAYGFVLAGKLEAAESLLRDFTSFQTVHPINRSRGYSALSKITSLQCLEKDELEEMLEQFRNEENRNQP